MWYKGYIHSIHACGFKTVFKKVMTNEFMKQAKGHEKGDDFTYLKGEF